MEEKIIYQQDNIKITTRLITIGTASYPTRNISGVYTTTSRPGVGTYLGLVILGLAALGGIIQGFEKGSGGSFVVGILCLGGGIVLWRSKRPATIVKLRTAGGDNDALRTHDQSKAQAISNAITEAISA